MSWIREIGKDEAEGRLKSIYESMKESRGKLSNIMKVHSLAPGSMQAHMELYLEIVFRKPGLGRGMREMLATMVSALNGCEYCKSHHGVALERYWKDGDAVERLRVGKTEGIELSEKDAALLEYATKLTLTPEKVEESDVRKLKDVGFSDEEILNACLTVSYFNFVNRVALGLGVEFNEEEMNGYKV